MKTILITLPAYNEEKIIGQNANTLKNFCNDNLNNYDWEIVIADNGSIDKTAEIAKQLEKESGGKIIYKPISAKGKGLAIRESWQSFGADIYVFMDADLSTGLSALPALIKTVEEESDVAIGSRIAKGAVAIRSLKRKIISRIFSLIVRFKFRLKINDYPCGFKAVNKKIIKEILPQIKNNAWFFDTELVIRTAKKGFKIKEIPVRWEDKDESVGRESKANLGKIIKEYLRELKTLKADLNKK